MSKLAKLISEDIAERVDEAKSKKEIDIILTTYKTLLEQL